MTLAHLWRCMQMHAFVKPLQFLLVQSFAHPHLPICHAAGHILYHGPRTEVMDFFRSLGFDLPKRKGIPDFLQEVSGKKDQAVHLLYLRAKPRDSAIMQSAKLAPVCFSIY